MVGPGFVPNRCPSIFEYLYGAKDKRDSRVFSKIQKYISRRCHSYLDDAGDLFDAARREESNSGLHDGGGGLEVGRMARYMSG